MSEPSPDGGRRPGPTIPIEYAVRLGVLLFVVYLASALLRPFLAIMIWSTILTVTMYPVFAWLRQRTRSSVLAAVLVTITSLVLVIGPIAVLCTSLVRSLQQLLHVVVSGTYTLPALPEAIIALPAIGDDIFELWSLAGNNFVLLLKEHAHSLVVPGQWLLLVIASLAGIVLTLAVAVVISGFMFVPGPRIVPIANEIASRIAGMRGERFVALAALTVRNVARGVIGISVLETLLLGVVFLAVGVPHAGLLALLALMLSIAQIGATYVAIPVAGWIWLSRDPLEAILFTIAIVIISALEHFAKPLVMGRGGETPTVVLFLGVLGGLAVYGLAGLFIGPVVFAVSYELIKSWLAAEPPDASPGDGSPTPAPTARDS